MTIFSKVWTASVISILMLSNVFEEPAFGDIDPLDDSMLSESFCLQVYNQRMKQIRYGDWKILDRDRKTFRQCMLKFSPPPDPNARLPRASQCLNVFIKIWDGGIENLQETDVPEELRESLGRCGNVIQVFHIPAGSMLPTLKTNDRIIVDKTAYRDRLPQRGDIIIFSPTEQLKREKFNDKFVKRIIGLPGERIAVKQGKVYVNGKIIQESYITEPAQYEHQSTLIPKNSYFVLGDNRNNSYDSHYWGFVPRNLIFGKIIWQSTIK